LASDQTPKRFLRFDQEGQKGTGVFLQLGASGQPMVSFRPNLSYASCIRLGQDFLAFKWIPLAIASYAVVQAARCTVVGEDCKKSCKSIGCICNTATNKCVDSSSSAGNPPGSSSSNSGDKVKVEVNAPAEVAGAY